MQKTPNAGSSRINPLDTKGVFHYNIIMEGFILYQISQYIYPLTLDGFNILDCGCGEGNNALTLAKYGARLSVLDISSEKIKKVRDRFTEEKTFVECTIANIEDWTPDTQYDIVLFTNVLHFIPDKRKALETILDALKPKGILIFTDLIDEEPTPTEIRNKILKNLVEDSISEGVFSIYDLPHEQMDYPHKHLIHYIIGTKK